MSSVAPKERKYLSAEALFRLVRSGFASLPDDRLGDTEIPLTDALTQSLSQSFSQDGIQKKPGELERYD